MGGNSGPAGTGRRIVRASLAILLGATLAASSAASGTPEISIRRLDCGEFFLRSDAALSGSYAAPPAPRRLSVGCYLIQHGSSYMIWDAGLPGELVGNRLEGPQQILTLGERIVDQLGRIGIRPDQIALLGLSHYHFDHLGQAADFPNARLAMGAEDVAIVRAQSAASRERRTLEPWLNGQRPLDEVSGDLDLFGDGSLVMLATPGHTPGHHSLLVRRAAGAVLLSGDLYVTRDQAARGDVPSFNQDRADTLASMDRFDKIRRNLRATAVIQHEPAHDRLIPAIPPAPVR